MTLLSPRRDPGRPAAGSGKAARRGPTAPPETVQTPLAAGIGAALWSAAFGLGLSVAAVLATWAISGRAAGHPRGAIVAGAQAWLLGNGTDLRLERGTLTLMPLGLTLLLVLLLARSGVWAGRAAMVQTLREAAVATACLVTVYVGIAVTLALLARSPDVTPVVPTALTGALAVSLLAGGAGVLHGSGLLGALLEPLPRQARLALRGAAGGLVALVAGGSVVFVASLAWHAQDAARLYSSLGADLAGSIELIGLCLAYAPVGVLWAMAYCLGPGFAVGTGTLVFSVRHDARRPAGVPPACRPARRGSRSRARRAGPGGSDRGRRRDRRAGRLGGPRTGSARRRRSRPAPEPSPVCSPVCSPSSREAA